LLALSLIVPHVALAHQRSSPSKLQHRPASSKHLRSLRPLRKVRNKPLLCQHNQQSPSLQRQRLSQPQAPAQNQAEPIPVPVQPAVAEPPVNLVPGRFRSLGHLGREVGLARGHECVNAMAAELWEHLELNNDDENELYLVIGRALNVLLPQADQNNIVDWNFPRWGVALLKIIKMK